MLATTPYRYILVGAAGDGTAVVTLNRPEKRNALSLDVMQELIAAFDAIGADRGLKVAILRAVGPAFSAGHDLREMLGRSVEEYRRTFDVCVRLMQTIQAIPQPVIAEVAGVATAAGCQLVATCDLAVASSEATFATPGVKIGLFCTTPMVALTRAIGRKRAMEMLLTGPADRRRDRRRLGLGERRRRPRSARGDDPRARGAHCVGRGLRDRLGQGGVLRSDRSRPAQGVRLRERGHVDERARRGRARRDGCVRHQAASRVAYLTR